jgi:hypothetical protein
VTIEIEIRKSGILKEGSQGTHSYELFYFFDAQKPSCKMECYNGTPA